MNDMHTQHLDTKHRLSFRCMLKTGSTQALLQNPRRTQILEQMAVSRSWMTCTKKKIEGVLDTEIAGSCATNLFPEAHKRVGEVIRDWLYADPEARV